MQKKLLQKSLTILFTAFTAVFLFGGGLGVQKAYAEDPTPAAKACTDADGQLQPDSSCFLPGVQDCSKLTGYEEKAPADNTGIVCQKSATGSVTNPEQEKIMKERISFIIEAQKWLNALIWPVLVMIGDLMNNNILFGAGMDERLREIWIPIRNLINLFFVLALVAIAIYNILGVGEDNDAYSIKQILPKMIIAIIAVNFSFLGIKVFLDGINVLTTSIFALPDQVREGLGDITKNEEVVKRFCLGTMGKTVGEVSATENVDPTSLDLESYKIITLKFAEQNKNLLQIGGSLGATQEETFKMLKGNLGLSDLTAAEFNKLPPTYFTTEGNSKLSKEFVNAADNRVCKNDATLTTRGKAFLTKYNSSNAALAMALSMSKIVFYQEIDITTLTQPSISKLLTNTVFSVVLYLIYVVSFLVLFIVLLARLVVMWLGVVASPIIIVSMILPVFKEKLGFGELVDKFVQNAIAPILIAFSMTVGWIMLRAIQGVNSLSSESVKIVNGIPVAGLNTIQDLIVALGTVGVIWMAVSSAANKSIAEPITKSLYGALGQAGSFVGNLAWKHTPFLPVSIPGQPDKFQASAAQVSQAWEDLKEKVQKTPDGKEYKKDLLSIAMGLRKPNQRHLSELDRVDGAEGISLMREARAELKTGGKNIDEKIKTFVDRNQQFMNDLERGEIADKKGEELAKHLRTMQTSQDEGERSKAREKIHDILDSTSGESIEKEAATWASGKGETKAHPAAKGTPAAKPAPDVKENDKIGTAEIGKDHVKQIADATDKLVEALKNPNNKKGDDLKAQIKAFELNGQKPLLPQLKAFITDPEAKRRLGEIFHSDADLQKVLSAAQAPGAAIPKGAIPEQVGKPQQGLASAAPLPQGQPLPPSKPVSPAEAPLVGQPPQVADAGNKGQPPQQNAGQSENKPGEVPPVA